MSKKNKNKNFRPEQPEELKNEPKEQTDQQETAELHEETPEKDEAKDENQGKINDLEAQLADYKDKYLRQLAEFDNYRKRTMKEKAELILHGGEKVMTSLLPVLDDFERAEKTLAEATDVKALSEGVELIFKKFAKTLEENGLKKIDTEGKDFDTDYHEAIAMVPTDKDENKGKVIDCVQTGYTLNDKVIRHAKVAIGQ